MLRSRHLVYKLYIRPKLRVSRYTGGRAMVCGILAGVIPFGLLTSFALLLYYEDRHCTVIKVLCYKSEGRWFDPRWCQWNFSLT